MLSRKFLIFFTIFLNLLIIQAKLRALEPIESYTHSLTVDENNPNQYKLFWKLVKDEIQVEAHCKTLGWIGTGISTDGRMLGIVA
jgi:hypothetical protein